MLLCSYVTIMNQIKSNQMNQIFQYPCQSRVRVFCVWTRHAPDLEVHKILCEGHQDIPGDIGACARFSRLADVCPLTFIGSIKASPIDSHFTMPLWFFARHKRKMGGHPSCFLHFFIQGQDKRPSEQQQFLYGSVYSCVSIKFSLMLLSSI